MCKDASNPNSGSDSGSSCDGGTTPCGCIVTVSPKPLTVCTCFGTETVNAVGNPGGGTCAWVSDDTSVATVTASGNPATVTGIKKGNTSIKVTYSASGRTCRDSVTVKVFTCTPGRKYTTGYKNVAGVTGVRANIKTRYGKLVCESKGATTSAYHVVYANTSNSTGTLIWAQSGFGRERNAGSAAITTYRYAEMNGGAYKVHYDTSHAPAEGSAHLYQCDLNNATGTWAYCQDGTKWRVFQDDKWKANTGTSVQYTGEIFNKEDDMPGTAANKCNITNCQYRVHNKAVKAADDAFYRKHPALVVGGVRQPLSPTDPVQEPLRKEWWILYMSHYEDAGLVAGDVRSDDAGEWGAEWVSATALNIWDKDPLP